MRYLFPLLLISIASASADAAALDNLSDAEQRYYEQVFSYAMETVKPGETYEWKTYANSGSITVLDSAFTSKSKSACRHFKERYTINGKSGRNEGAGCRRNGRDGWCKLKPKEAQTCIIEPPRNLLERTLEGGESTVRGGQDWLTRLKGWFW